MRKKCSQCTVEQPLEDFYNHSGTKDGKQSRCKTCQSILTPEGKLKKKDRDLQRYFGITLKEYRKMHNDQGGCCEICGRIPSTEMLAVDHCHATGKVRALLCRRCNTALALLDEDIDSMQQMIRYKNKHG